MVRRRPPALQLSKDTLDPCSPVVRRTPDSAQSWRSCRSQFSKVPRPPALNVDVQCPSRPTFARRSPDHEKAWEDDTPEGPSGGANPFAAVRSVNVDTRVRGAIERAKRRAQEGERKLLEESGLAEPRTWVTGPGMGTRKRPPAVLIEPGCPMRQTIAKRSTDRVRAWPDRIQTRPPAVSVERIACDDTPHAPTKVKVAWQIRAPTRPPAVTVARVACCSTPPGCDRR